MNTRVDPRLSFPVILAIAVSMMFAAALVSFPIIRAGMIVLCLFCFAILASIDTRKIFSIFLVWTILSGGLSQLLFARVGDSLKYVDSVFIVILLLKLFSAFVDGYRFDGNCRKIITLAALFVFWASFSALINGSSLLGLLFFVNSYVKFFVIFIAAFVFLDRTDFDGLIGLMLACGVLQLMVAGVQLLTYGRGNLFVGGEINLWQDAACGTFGHYGAHKLGHFSLIMLMVSFSAWFYTSAKRWLFWALLFTCVFFITFTEQDYVPFAFFFIFSIFCSRQIRASIRIFTAAMLISIFGIILLAGFNPAARYFDLLSRSGNAAESGKAQNYLTSARILAAQPANLMIGIGPGGYSSGAAFKVKGDYYVKYIESKYRKIKSTMDYLWATATSVMVETGIVGYSLYAAAYLIILFNCFTLFFGRGPAIDNYGRAIIYSELFVLGFMLYLSLLSNIIEWISFVYPAAIISAFAFKIGRPASYG